MSQETQLHAHASGAPITVLLVDDQRFIGLALERLFATEPDIKLHCCETSQDAVSRANAIEPTIILQDLVMPGISGLELVGLFRRNAATARTPIIVLSGNEDAGCRDRSLAAGANDYMLKLPAKEELIACIRTHAAGPSPAVRHWKLPQPPNRHSIGKSSRCSAIWTAACQRLRAHSSLCSPEMPNRRSRR
jgi:PleD family two-component response regulator